MATAVVALEQLHHDVIDFLICFVIDARQLDEGVVGRAAAAMVAAADAGAGGHQPGTEGVTGVGCFG